MKWLNIPIKNGSEIFKFFFVNKKRAKKLTRANNKLWERYLPVPKPKRKIGLSIISGSKEPITNAILLNFNCFIWGTSVKISGKATWNIG